MFQRTYQVGKSYRNEHKKSSSGKSDELNMFSDSTANNQTFTLTYLFPHVRVELAPSYK